ncbi:MULTISPECIES: cupin domain-containing protein [Halorussus]|uniref:cupin domain-containing protein n=1 Tax=Halorussus TaxID=1070314 RepID=UPI000E21978F|nr:MULTISPECIES: cupin domain-containing protein [Halorussus]NHN60156.1 cupin domain-containing protein [Halorussus sp. JP-T4]
MGTITTGRPLDEDGAPTDGPALELDPDGAAADLFTDSTHPLTSSPGTGMWAAVLEYPDEVDARPALLVWLSPDATELPAHVHTNDEETFRAVEGELTLVEEGEPRRLDPGEEHTVSPGRSHYFRNDTDDFVAFYAEPPWRKTVDTQLTFSGLDHEGAFGSAGEYGEPGPLYGLVMSEYISDGTRVTTLPVVVQRLLWATLGRVAKALGYRPVEERFLRDEFWTETVEQPEI